MYIRTCKKREAARSTTTNETSAVSGELCTVLGQEGGGCGKAEVVAELLPVMIGQAV